MPEREGVVRRYVLGLDMLTVPGYRSAGAFSHTKPLPGVLLRAPALPHRTGPTALAQAMALLTGRRVGVPAVVSVAGVLAQARRWLPDAAASWVGESHPGDLLAQCRDTVDAGGLVLLQWRSLPRQGSSPSSRWMLAVGLQGPWRAPAGAKLCEACALLVLDATVPAVWGAGHNMHLLPEAHPDQGALQEGGAQAAWTARTLEGGLERGVVTAAVILQPLPGSSFRAPRAV